MANRFKQILWPSWGPSDADRNRPEWRFVCVLLVIPVTAILHHVVFHRPTCMLNNFGEAYYIPSVLFEWLSGDPSLPWAIVASVTVYHVGKNSSTIRWLTAPIFIAFLPLSLWIWDIPLTGRVICDHFHDDQLVFFDHPMRTRYLYLFGLSVYGFFLVKNWVLPSSKPVG